MDTERNEELVVGERGEFLQSIPSSLGVTSMGQLLLHARAVRIIAVQQSLESRLLRSSPDILQPQQLMLRMSRMS